MSEADKEIEKTGLNVKIYDIFLKRQFETKDEVIRFVADVLQKNGYVSADFTDAMFAREEQVSTYLTNGVAIPNSSKEYKHLVKKKGIVVVQLPNGVDWGEETVHLVLGVASNEEEHLEVLTNLSDIVMDKELTEKLGTTSSIADIIATLTKKPRNKQTKKQDDFDTNKTVAIKDEQGIHARPAAQIVKIAKAYKDAQIRVRNADKTADATSVPQLLSLGVRNGDSVIVSAEGVQAQDAVNEIVNAIEKGLED